MARSKVAISLDESTLNRLDQLVKNYRNLTYRLRRTRRTAPLTRNGYPSGEMMECRRAKPDVAFDRRHYRPLMAGFVVLCVLACAQVQKDEAPVPVASQLPPP